MKNTLIVILLVVIAVLCYIEWHRYNSILSSVPPVDEKIGTSLVWSDSHLETYLTLLYVFDTKGPEALRTDLLSRAKMEVGALNGLLNQVGGASDRLKKYEISEMNCRSRIETAKRLIADRNLKITEPPPIP